MTNANYYYLQNNATLVYTPSGGTSNDSSSSPSLLRCAVDGAFLVLRDGTEVTVNDTSAQVGGDGSAPAEGAAGGGSSKDMKFVSGLQAYVEELSVTST